MKNLVSLSLLALLGCSVSSPPPVPPTTGDFVSNDGGIGTAQVFGVQFSVRANSSGSSTQDAISIDFVNAEQSSAEKRFTIGDDVAIQLEKVNQSEVRFLFNDQDFGTLKVGDKVVIDDERNVEVNGTRRPLNRSEQ